VVSSKARLSVGRKRRLQAADSEGSKFSEVFEM
jgi:hypothetical protein